MIRNGNGIARKPPARSTQVDGTTRISRQLAELIEGHAKRILYHGGLSEDISDQVAEILGVPRPLAERTVNQYFAVVLRERDRAVNAMVNGLSHVRATRADMEDAAA